MKVKNFNSAIRNFAHSLQSIDYTHSGSLAVNALVALHKAGISPNVTFDFMELKIEPAAAVSKSSLRLLNDYRQWLPDHLKNSGCDFSLLEKLSIRISATFPLPKKGTSVIVLNTHAEWKLKGRDTEQVDISESIAVKAHHLESGIPEL